MKSFPLRPILYHPKLADSFVQQMSVYEPLVAQQQNYSSALTHSRHTFTTC